MPGSSLSLRLLTTADLAFADSLRALAGWNQTEQDWRRFLECDPEGCFIAEWEGAPAGTATTTSYGDALAWIGMLLVHPNYRRRGIGTMLFQQCLSYLKNRHVHCAKLDATPLGRPLYRRLGFQEEWALTRWESPSPTAPTAADQYRIRPWQERDFEVLAAVDRGAFGAVREGLLRYLARDSVAALVSISKSGQATGYGLLRRGARALYVGPIVGTTPREGLALASALLSRAVNEPIYWDIPDPNEAAVDFARRRGFTRQRQLFRMYLGRNECPGDPRRQFAIADPAIG